MAPSKKLAVVAIGGNSLIRDKDHLSIPSQYEAAALTAHHIADMIENGWNVVVTHGNGPQMGFILRRSELSIHEVSPVPMDYAGADLQGSIGYMFVKAFRNEFQRRGLQREPVAVVTETLVDRDDPAFKDPTKPIGSHMDEAKAKELAAKQGWVVRDDAGRGWRRVVPSPIPREIIDYKAIEHLVRAGFVVIGCGGGGIPVIRNDFGRLAGRRSRDRQGSRLRPAGARDRRRSLPVVDRGRAGGHRFQHATSTLARSHEPQRSAPLQRRRPIRQRQHGAEDSGALRIS